jgi:outer membrane protein assembly factor BamB
MFAAPSRRGVDVLPGPGGGSNWSPLSVNENLGLAVATAINSPATFYGNDTDASGNNSLSSHVVHHGRGAVYGLASAIDLNDGRMVWQDRFSEPMIGGSVSSAGGITVFGESSGDVGAVETNTGRLLWRFYTGAGVNAPPVIYEENGHEYIAVASGGNERVHSHFGDSIFVFSLPRRWDER